MARLYSPNTRIDWFPEGHFSNPHYPTVAELNSGYNLSRAIVTGSEVDFVDPTTENTTTIFDMFESETIRANRYEANLSFELNAPQTAFPVEARTHAEQLFYRNHNAVGYIGKRFGYSWNTPYNGGDTLLSLDIFKVQADLPKLNYNDNQTVLLGVKYIPLGEAFRVHLVNYVTYNDFAKAWETMTYSHVQDVYSGQTYSNFME